MKQMFTKQKGKTHNLGRENHISQGLERDKPHCLGVGELLGRVLDA